MLRKIKRFFIGTVILIILAGAGLYWAGTKLFSDQLASGAAAYIEKNIDWNSLKQQVKENPEVQQLIKESAEINTSDLPFQTKEEAIQQLVPKFNPAELKNIQENVQNGISGEEKKALLQTLESKLTAEEMEALKAVVSKELTK